MASARPADHQRCREAGAEVVSAYPRPIRRLAITRLGVLGRRHPAGGIWGDSRRSHCVDGPSQREYLVRKAK